MRYRVERTRADHGYGDGWVVLDDLGTVVWQADSWRYALGGAWLLIAAFGGAA